MKKRVNNVSRPAVGGSVKWLCAALCLAAGFGLSACSDDDEGEGGGAGGGVAAQQMPLVANAGIQFPVTQYSDDPYSVKIFTYSGGRMTEMYEEDNQKVSISTHPLVIREIYYMYGHYYEESVFRNIKQNDRGFMTFAEYEEENGTCHICSLEYDAEGHLIKDTSHGDDGYSSTCSYTWEDGNLTSAVYSTEGGSNYRKESSFTYDVNKWENPGVYPAQFIDVSDRGEALFYAGLFGRSTKNIPVSVTERISQIGHEPETLTYQTVAVNYNPDGSVESIEVQLNGSSYTQTYRYGYADYPIKQEEAYSAASSVKGGQAAKSLKRARRMARR